MYKKIIAAAFAVCAVSSVQAYAEYSFPYNPDTGFDVPYTKAEYNDLEKPEWAVGEVHDGYRRDSEEDYYSGAQVTLPNGNKIYNHYPELKLIGATRDNMHEETVASTWDFYYPDGELIMRTKEEIERGLQYVGGIVFYKNHLFVKGYNLSNQSSNSMMLDMESFEPLENMTGGILNPFEVDVLTLPEYNNLGYELTAGNYIKGLYVNYFDFGGVMPNSYFTISYRNDYFCFDYSCDAVNYMKVALPSGMDDRNSYFRVGHYLLNGEDCVVLLCDTDAYAYRVSDLQKCWNEYTSHTPYVYLNDIRLSFERPPIIQQDYTLIPLRFLLETAGAAVNWNEETQSADIYYNDKSIKIIAGSMKATIDDREYTLDVPAQIIDDKMMIPLRFVSEGLGFGVKWEEETRSIYITAEPDNIHEFIPLFSSYTLNEDGVRINDEVISSINTYGRTLIPIQMLEKYFDFDENNEITLKSKPDSSINLSDDFSFDMDLFMSRIYKDYGKEQLIYKNICVPNYLMTNRNNKINYSKAQSDMFENRLLCIEDASDKMDCLYYNWNGETNIVDITISDDMVTYDNALKSILDKKNISYDEEYTGDYYIDITKAQEYTENDISVLVQAGVYAGIIRESDYPDHHMRPTRNISHMDLARMLGNIGYNYTYDICDKDKPITQEEFNSIIKDLDLL